MMAMPFVFNSTNPLFANPVNGQTAQPNRLLSLLRSLSSYPSPNGRQTRHIEQGYVRKIVPLVCYLFYRVSTRCHTT